MTVHSQINHCTSKYLFAYASILRNEKIAIWIKMTDIKFKFSYCATMYYIKLVNHILRTLPLWSEIKMYTFQTDYMPLCLHIYVVFILMLEKCNICTHIQKLVFAVRK